LLLPPLEHAAYDRGGPTINLPLRQFIHQKLKVVNRSANELVMRAGLFNLRTKLRNPVAVLVTGEGVSSCIPVCSIAVGFAEEFVVVSVVTFLVVSAFVFVAVANAIQAEDKYIRIMGRKIILYFN
jgi:hypothetical protein